jgi:hypothetical protein
MQSLGQDMRKVWALWTAAGIVAVGGLLPLVFGGTSSRSVTVIVPFLVAALALAACGRFNTQSRTVLYVIYFVAGLAIVYGLFSMFAVPLELAVLGSCPAAPAPCPTGLPRPLTDGETTGMGAAAAFGIVALLLGFYGLVVASRRAQPPQSVPMVRQVPPIASTVAPAEPEPELPAHEEVELPELPPHETTSATT